MELCLPRVVLREYLDEPVLGFDVETLANEGESPEHERNESYS